MYVRRRNDVYDSKFDTKNYDTVQPVLTPNHFSTSNHEY